MAPQPRRGRGRNISKFQQRVVEFTAEFGNFRVGSKTLRFSLLCLSLSLESNVSALPYVFVNIIVCGLQISLATHLTLVSCALGCIKAFLELDLELLQPELNIIV